MPYQVLARKWRPKNFQSLVGQSVIVQSLSNALTTGRLHHAYLFSGTRGVGKTTIARILSKSLNCEQGITATPCGICEVCVAIDEGCFPDLIEVDAASNTKVEDTRALLENIPYAPAIGRYKVYLIDEVHMLSTHSFNALLKTLEEPPSHVIFIVATTEPEKIPMTLLSRCLQFQLQPLSVSTIEQQLAFILGEEQQPFENEALRAIAVAARGSMRDALSLVERFMGSDCLRADEVHRSLGTVHFEASLGLIELLAQGLANELLLKARELLEKGVMPQPLCDSLLQGFHCIAMRQVVSAYPLERGEAVINSLAKTLSKESVQLFYQITLMGKESLNQAPTPEMGVEMMLLRLLAFYPQSPRMVEREPSVAVASEAVVESAMVVAVPVAASPSTKTDSWEDILPQLALTGLVKMIAENSICEHWDNEKIVLILDEEQHYLLNDDRKKALEQALSKYRGQPVKLKIKSGAVSGETPHQKNQQKMAEQSSAVQSSVNADPFIQSMVQEMGATIESLAPTSGG